jgi:hypothetical protein
MLSITVVRNNLIHWLLSKFSAAQWETMSMLFHLDSMVTLQESMTDTRHGHFVSHRNAFADLDDIF